jgi:hypothetical protein
VARRVCVLPRQCGWLGGAAEDGEAGLGGNGKFADLAIVFVDRYDRSGPAARGVSLSCRPSRGRKSI